MQLGDMHTSQLNQFTGFPGKVGAQRRGSEPCSSEVRSGYHRNTPICYTKWEDLAGNFYIGLKSCFSRKFYLIQHLPCCISPHFFWQYYLVGKGGFCPRICWFECGFFTHLCKALEKLLLSAGFGAESWH